MIVEALSNLDNVFVDIIDKARNIFASILTKILESIIPARKGLCDRYLIHKHNDEGNRNQPDDRNKDEETQKSLTMETSRV